MAPKPRNAKKPRVAAFVGRFQPVHLGHIAGIQHLAAQHQQVHIVVASFSRRSRVNPLTAREAKYLLAKALQEAGVDMARVTIHAMRRPKSYHGDPLFYIHAELRRRIGAPFTFYTGNTTVHEVLKSKGLDVRYFERLPLGTKGKTARVSPENLTATNIRERMAKGKPWEHLVPPAAAAIIKKRGLHERIMQLHQSGKRGHSHYK